MRSKAEVRHRWDRMARYYENDNTIWLERVAYGSSREWVCQRATGRTLEVAVGSGLNLALYPDDLELVGVDLSPAMLALARSRAARLGRRVHLSEGDAENLPFGDGSFDTVVCTLAICEVPDRPAAIGEMYRVLRAGGRLLLLDHVEPRWRHGRPVTLAVAQGFQVERRERLRLGLIERVAAIRADPDRPDPDGAASPGT